MPVETLHRYAAVRADSTGGRTVFGVAMPYGQVAEVNDGFGPYREMFAPGAFARSISERGSKIKLVANHDLQSFPVGRATELVERDDGLHAAFAVAATPAGDDVLELVRSGTVDSFSVGFKPIKNRQEHGVTVRVEAALREISLTSFPAYDGAAVGGVRSATPTLSVDLARRRLDLLIRNW